MYKAEKKDISVLVPLALKKNAMFTRYNYGEKFK